MQWDRRTGLRVGVVVEMARPERLPRVVKVVAAGWSLAASSDWFTLWALLWVSGPRGWSGGQIAVLIVAARAPSLLGGIAGGIAVDRFGPRHVMLFDAASRTTVLASFVVCGLLGALTYPVCVALVALSGSTAPASYSAVRTLMPSLVPNELLGRANTWLAMGNALPLVLSASLVGPALALVGLRYAFVLPLLAMWGYAGICLRLRTLTIRDTAATPGATQRTEVGSHHSSARARALGRHPLSGPLALLLLSAGYYLSFGPFEPVLPFLIREQLKAGPGTYGLLWGAVGIGCLLGLLAAPWLCSLPRPGVVNALIAITNSAVMVPLAVAASTGMALVLCFGIGLLWSPYNAVEATALQKLTPARQLGKIFGLQRALAISALPVGAAIGSLGLDHIGPGRVILASGCSGLAVALIALSFPALRVRKETSGFPSR